MNLSSTTLSTSTPNRVTSSSGGNLAATPPASSASVGDQATSTSEFATSTGSGSSSHHHHHQHHESVSSGTPPTPGFKFPAVSSNAGKYSITRKGASCRVLLQAIILNIRIACEVRITTTRRRDAANVCAAR